MPAPGLATSNEFVTFGPACRAAFSAPDNGLAGTKALGGELANSEIVQQAGEKLIKCNRQQLASHGRRASLMFGLANGIQSERRPSTLLAIGGGRAELIVLIDWSRPRKSGKPISRFAPHSSGSWCLVRARAAHLLPVGAHVRRLDTGTAQAEPLGRLASAPGADLWAPVGRAAKPRQAPSESKHNRAHEAGRRQVSPGAGGPKTMAAVVLAPALNCSPRAPAQLNRRRL